MITETDELQIVMEYVAGGSLADTLEHKGSLPGHRVAELIAQVADALAIAHDHELLHLNIKPSNILLDSEGGPVLSDFGHARLTATTGQPTSTNAAYFDPALAEGQPAGPPSDIYSLGAICYQALTGAAPFSGDTPLQILRSARTQPLRPLVEAAPDVSPALARAVERAMARRPQDRFQTASELSSALRQAIGMPVIDFGDTPTRKRASRERPRRARPKLARPRHKAPAPVPERAPSVSSPQMPAWSWRHRRSGMALALALALGGIVIAGALILPRALSSKTEQEAARRALPTGKAPASQPDQPAIQPSPPVPSLPAEPPPEIPAPTTDSPPAPPPDGPRTRTPPAGSESTEPAAQAAPPAAVEPASPSPSPIPPAVPRPIVFTANSDGNKEIYLVNDDGTGLTNLTRNAASDRQPALSPDGSEVAFVSNREGDDDIYIIKTDRSSIRKLTDNDATDLAPAWSPDGARIAFASQREGRAEIYVIGADGSGERRLTQNTGTHPIWSPDGAKIAFASLHENANSEIHVINADGSAETRITENSAVELEPDWSSDGRMAFTTTREGTLPGIYMMNADGTAQTKVTSGQSPAWSIGGTRLAFCRFGNLYVQEADGTQKRIVNDKKAADTDW